MRRVVLGMLTAAFLATSTGCVIPIYSPDRTRRTSQLLISSENLRVITDEWERAWLLDQPSHITAYRVHGGML